MSRLSFDLVHGLLIETYPAKSDVQRKVRNLVFDDSCPPLVLNLYLSTAFVAHSHAIKLRVTIGCTSKTESGLLIQYC